MQVQTKCLPTFSVNLNHWFRGCGRSAFGLRIQSPNFEALTDQSKFDVDFATSLTSFTYHSMVSSADEPDTIIIPNKVLVNNKYQSLIALKYKRHPEAQCTHFSAFTPVRTGMSSTAWGQDDDQISRERRALKMSEVNNMSNMSEAYRQAAHEKR